MKNIVVLGATGSIGTNALAVIKNLGPEYAVCGITARSQWDQLHYRMNDYHPRTGALVDRQAAETLRAHLAEKHPDEYPSRLTILDGEEGICAVAAMPEADIVISAVMGSAGLAPGFAALKAKKTLALANKESLVMAGPLMMECARENGVEIIPIDSEPSAIFQALRSGRRDEARRVFLTASGGPFADCDMERMRRVTPQEALNHPVWKMGAKITVDSATMMNKALEIVEARWLFDLKPSQIEVVVHPQSIVHSMVEFQDGSVIAQMGLPDMKVPIQYALTHPARMNGTAQYLDLTGVGSLTFKKPDPERFPAIRLGYEAAERGGTLGAVMSAANEAAVAGFLAGACSFTDIVETVAAVMKEHRAIDRPTMDDILNAARWASNSARQRTSGK